MSVLVIELDETALSQLQASISTLHGVVPAMVHYAYDEFAELPGMDPAFLADREVRELTLTNFLQNVLLASLRAGDMERVRAAMYRLGIIHGGIGMTDDVLRSWVEIFVAGMTRATGKDWATSYAVGWHDFLKQTEVIMLQGAREGRAARI